MAALEKLLGHSLPADSKKSIGTLNELPADALLEATNLARQSRLAAAEYLLYYVRDAELDHASEFVDDVLLGGADPHSWGIADVLFVPALDLASALQIDVAALLAPLSAMAGERWWRIEPKRARWDWSGLCGAPGARRRHATYSWATDAARAGVDAHASGDEPLELMSDPMVAARRWLSSRIQWELRDIRGISSISDICSALGIRQDALSSDGHKVFAGLEREMPLAPEEELAPGFRGPDWWYAGSHE